MKVLPGRTKSWKPTAMSVVWLMVGLKCSPLIAAGILTSVPPSLDGSFGVDAIGNYESSDEGPRLYAGTDPGYSVCGSYRCNLNPPPRLPAVQPVAGRTLMAQANASATLLVFPGASAHRTPDVDANGRFDALEVDVIVDVLAAGNYVVLGRLQGSNGQLVANRPHFKSMLMTRANFSSGPGRRTISPHFSGEQIREARIDGPYNIALYANSATEAAGSAGLVVSDASASTTGSRRLCEDDGRMPVQLVGSIRERRLIGAKGFDGPYLIRSLLIASASGAYPVGTLAGETSAWQARQFEGFVVRLPG